MHPIPDASLCFQRQCAFCADIGDHQEKTQGGFILLLNGDEGTAADQHEVTAGLL